MGQTHMAKYNVSGIPERMEGQYIFKEIMAENSPSLLKP